MKSVKGVFKFFAKAVVGLVVFLLLYAVTTVILSAIPIQDKSEFGKIEIWVLSTGVHTDIVVPYSNQYFDWSTLVKTKHTKAQREDLNWLAMGWGDKGFYLDTPTWADLKASTAIKAATGINSTAIHATFYDKLEEAEKCKKLIIGVEEYRRLIKYIFDSFHLDEDFQSQQVVTDAVYGNNDAFYEAKGRYSLFKTCNSWANAGLKAAGQKACLWTALDTPIFDKYND